jgi:hypothetical protein
MRKTIVVSLGLLFPQLIFAVASVTVPQQAPSASTQENIPAKDFKFTGYIDTSYNHLKTSNHFTSGNFDRVFDIEPNGLTLQQAAISLAYQPTHGFGGLVTLISGRDAYQTISYGMAADIGLGQFGLDLSQMYVQYAAGKVTTIVGKFDSLVSQEATDPTKNTNFSRAYLSGPATPFAHMGVRITMAATEQLSWYVGLNNGWDDVRDLTRKKTIELGVASTDATIPFGLYIYSGGQRAQDNTATGPIGTRTLINFLGTYNVTNYLSFAFDSDYAIQTKAAVPDGKIAKAIWKGIAGYVNYKFNDTWRTSFRAEIFDDHDGYRTGVTQTLKDVTLTVGYAPCKNLELRLETRHDFSNASSFVKKHSHRTTDNNQSYALEAVYSFGR